MVVPDHASGTYARGEAPGWTLTLPTGEDAGGAWRYRLMRNGAVEILSGTLKPEAVTTRIVAPAYEPATYLLLLTQEGADAKAKPLKFGASVAAEELRPVVPRPKDFDDFWAKELRALRRMPENVVYTPLKSPLEGIEYGTVRLDFLGGEHVYGQFARPAKPGKYPAVLVMQWASPPYPLDPQWVMWRAKQGFLVLNIQPHDVLPVEPPAYYAALPDALKNYGSIGADSRERSYFTRMYLRDVRGADYLTHRPDWDGKTLVATGASMGGQQTLAVAALQPKVTHAIAEEPGGCDLMGPLHGRSGSYPFPNLSDLKIRAATPYIDIVNFAPRIRAKTLVGMGYIDETCPPVGVWTAINGIRAPKRAIPLPEAPHVGTATPAQMAPFRSRSDAWFKAIAAGKPVPMDQS